jgi:hypothetical protein
MSVIYLYPSNLDLDGQDIAIAFDEQEKIARPIKWVDRKYPNATERQNRDLVMERYAQHR